MKNVDFKELQADVQEFIKNSLKAFDDIDVWYEYGRYTYGCSICAKYAPDHKFIGTYKASDVYTEEERIVNYCNEFHDYPYNYKGNRDYSLIRDYDAQYKLVNGNIVRAE